MSNKINAIYDSDEMPIAIGMPLIGLLLKQDKCADLLMLYCFYLYTAKHQKTNRPFATRTFTQKGLNWSKPRFAYAKRELKKLKLIEDHVDRDPETNLIRKHYIKVNFIWTKKTLDGILEEIQAKIQQEKEGKNNETPGGTKPHPVADITPNALSNNNLNALSFLKKKESENFFPSLYKLFYTKFLKKKRGVYINYLKKNINTEDMLSYQGEGYSDFAILVDVPAFIETSCRMLYHMQTHYSIQYTDSQLTDGFVHMYTLLSDNKVEMKTLSSVVDWYGVAEHREADFTTKIRTPLGLTIEGFTGLLESMQSFERNKNKAKRGSYAKKEEGPVPTRT
jgi:hypothetical protein